jgi:nicotinamidase-related amidase
MEELSLKALRSFAGVGAVEIASPSTALLIIDMQNSYLRDDGFTVRRLLERGLNEAVAQYQRQLRRIIPNLRRVVDRFRSHGQMIVFVNSVNYPGRQSGGQTMNQWFDPDSPAAAIPEELGRRPEDLLISKSCPGVFIGSTLDLQLRRREVTNLVVGGVVTNGCVEQAIEQAHDLTYACVLLSDGSAAVTNEIHENALERLEHRRAHVRSTDHVLASPVIEATNIAIVPTGPIVG